MKKKKPRRNKIRAVALFLVLVVSFVSCDNEPSPQNSQLTSEQANNNGIIVKGEPLPFFGPITREGNDTLFYEIPKFTLTNQDSSLIGYSSFAGKPLIVKFFFTSCSTICPIMTESLVDIQRSLEAKGVSDAYNFLAVSINPGVDKPSVLLSYAKEKDINLSNWTLAMAEKDYVDELSKEGFFLAVDRDAAYQDGIVHSSQVILVDGKRRIRGSYDAIDEEELTQLESDILKLIKHEEQ